MSGEEILEKTKGSTGHSEKKWRRETMVVDVYVKCNKNEEFKRYHLNLKKEQIYNLYNILYFYRKENIIENFYIYES